MQSPSRAEQIRRSIDRAAHFLPTQGPIDVFIHHNTLHAFEDQPFEEAVIEASRLFGTEPFLTESRYRQELERGRIRSADLAAVLDHDLGERGAELLAGGRVTLRSLLFALLEHPVRQENDVAVRWTLTESDTVDSGDAAELWHACVEAISLSRPLVVHTRPPVRHRDLLRAIDPNVDTDELVHPLLIRWCAAYLDQGVAAWPMPGRDRGLLAAVTDLYASPFGPTEPWSGRLPQALADIRGRDGIDVIASEIDRLGVPLDQQDELITRSLLTLRGWAGMIRHFEERPDRAPVEAVPARLADFLALRLVLDRVAAEWVAPRFGRPGDLPGLWTELRDRYPPRRGPGTVARAYLLYQVAKLVGLSVHDIRSLDENEMMRLERAIAGFDAITRRRLFHLAYERRHRIEVLDALAAHVGVAAPPGNASERPVVQAIFCIDERCESFRRHLEELDPGCETFGTAGFFAVPMYYRGVDDWHARPLCPIVIRPRHMVVESPVEEAAGRLESWRRLRRGVGRLAGGVSEGSRTLFRGSLFAAVGGAIAAIPLVARVAFPRLSALLGRRAVEIARRGIPTRLDLERHDPEPLPDGTLAGFDVDEMAGIVRRVLEDIGLTHRFARLVAVLGHGSSSRNNPHESAYDCGACGGGRGGPNARAFALMANDPRVRERLAAAGLAIPADTWFIGAMQDTCADAVVFFDESLIPQSHRADMQRLLTAIDRAREANARERCRRFETAPLDVSAADALRHVEERSHDLAQVRPELGHATNAVCIIGRRWRTRGLFLDRRAFLVSYDPAADADGEILTRTLAAVGPVGAGINLEYLFSTVDSVGYGCGTKLPHNITGLIGVMDGHASDLRTGLPWQMVEIHEPVRLLVVIDAPQERILAAAARLPAVQRLVVNHWIQLVAWESADGGSHPADGSLAVFEDGEFRPFVREAERIPIVKDSLAWYAGHRSHLPPARVLAALSSQDPR